MLTEQKENTDKYYDNVTESLEKDKEIQEKIYDAVIDILDDVDGKQTESNTEFISGLTTEDISKAIESLPYSEQQALAQSGIVKDNNGSLSLDYSDLDKLPDKIADAVTESKYIPYTQIDPATIKDNQTAQLIALLQGSNIEATGAINVMPKQPALSSGSEVSNYININTNPVYNSNITINGNTNQQTVDAIQTQIENTLVEYTQKLGTAVHLSTLRLINRGY